MKLIIMIVKYCKKIVATLLICAMLLSPTNSYAAGEKYMADEETRIELLNKAEIVDWEEFDKIMSIGSRFIVVDYKSGRYWIAERHMGGNHADIETINRESTSSIEKLYGDKVFVDSDNWTHRPVLIVFEDGRVYVASSFIKEHAGRDDKPYLQKVKNRSGGYKEGENYDKIKGNSMDGHMCVHVKKSKNHFDDEESEVHQDNINFLKNEKNKFK